MNRYKLEEKIICLITNEDKVITNLTLKDISKQELQSLYDFLKDPPEILAINIRQVRPKCLIGNYPSIGKAGLNEYTTQMTLYLGEYDLLITNPRCYRAHLLESIADYLESKTFEDLLGRFHIKRGSANNLKVFLKIS